MILRMVKLTERAVPSEPFTREEVAELLRISTRTVDRMIRAGELPKLPLPGRLVRIPRESVLALAGASR